MGRTTTEMWVPKAGTVAFSMVNWTTLAGLDLHLLGLHLADLGSADSGTAETHFILELVHSLIFHPGCHLSRLEHTAKLTSKKASVRSVLPAESPSVLV